MHRDQLYGLRAVCFFAVFAAHGDLPHFWFLGYGLTIYFILSGFLITHSLMEDETGRFWGDLGRFYGRRSLRILPVYFLVLTALWAAGWLRDPAWFFTYLFNVKLFLISVTGKLRDVVARAHTGGVHFWSLCVDEQFYLLYPLFLLPLARRWRSASVAVLIAASIAARLAFARLWPNKFYGALLPVCGENILWGCLAYCLHRDGFFRGLRWGWLMGAGVLVVSSLVLFGMPEGAYSFRHVFMVPTYRQTVSGVGFALVVLAFWLAEGSWLARLFSLKPLVYLGRISYGMYLVHMFTFAVLESLTAAWPPLGRVPPAAGRVALTIGAAALSWRFFEEPIYSLKRNFVADKASARRSPALAPVRS